MENGIRYDMEQEKEMYRQYYGMDDPNRVPESAISVVLVVIAVIVLIPGLVCNPLVVVALMNRRKPRGHYSQITETLTALQAHTETLCLISFLIPLIARQGFGLNLEVGDVMFCKSLSAMFCFAYGVSSYVIVMISVARYIAVYHPFLYGRLMTRKNAMIGVIIIFAISFSSIINFATIRTSHQIYLNGSLFQFCGTERPNPLNLLPFLFFAGIAIAVPCLVLFILVFLASLPAFLPRYPKPPAMLNNNVIALINLMLGLPVTLLYSISLPDFNKSNPVLHTILDATLIIAMLPKTSFFFIIYFSSPQFKSSFMKVLKNSSLYSYLSKRDFVKRQQVVSANVTQTRSLPKQRQPSRYVDTGTTTGTGTFLQSTTLGKQTSRKEL